VLGKKNWRSGEESLWKIQSVRAEREVVEGKYGRNFRQFHPLEESVDENLWRKGGRTEIEMRGGAIDPDYARKTNITRPALGKKIGDQPGGTLKKRQEFIASGFWNHETPKVQRIIWGLATKVKEKNELPPKFTLISGLRGSMGKDWGGRSGDGSEKGEEFRR